MSVVSRNHRSHQRRGRFGFLYKMLSVIALTAAVFMGASVFFRVESITVVGNIRYDAAQVEQASGIVRSSNLFRLNKYDTASRIRRQLPYIESVNIRRSLPDTLIITVQECNAAAQLIVGDGGWLISAAGKLLDWSDTPFTLRIAGLDPVLPEAGANIMAKPEQQQRLDCLLSLLQAMEQHSLLERVSRIDLTGRRSITMKLDDRFTVQLPVDGDFSYLLGAMDKAVQTLEPYEHGTLDLTIKDYTVVFTPG